MFEKYGMDAEALHDLYAYDYDAGRLTHRMGIDRWRCGVPVGNVGRRGELVTQFECGVGPMIPVSQIIWAMVMCEWPKGALYYRNGKPSDNRIVNLTEKRPIEGTKGNGSRQTQGAHAQESADV